MKNLIDRLDEIQNFSALANDLGFSTLKVRCWRGRFVTVSGYSGYARIVDIMSVFFRLLKNQKNLYGIERECAIKCASIIDDLYCKGEYIKVGAIDLRFKYILYYFSVMKDTNFADDHALGFWEFVFRKALEEKDLDAARACL